MKSSRFGLLLTLLLLPLGFAEEACTAALAKAADERTALSTELRAEQENVKTLTARLATKEEALQKIQLEVSSHEAALAKARSEVSSVKEELQKAQSEATAFRSSRAQAAEELEQKTSEWSQCTSDLQIAKGAEKQLEKELSNSFARVQILSSETKQLSTRIEQLQTELDEKDKIVGAAMRRADAADFQAASLKEEIRKQSGFEWRELLSQKADATIEKLSKLSPYWESLKEKSSPRWEALMASSAAQTLQGWFQTAKTEFAKKLNALWARAAPYVSDAYKLAEQYTTQGTDKVNAAYVSMKPALDAFLDTTTGYSKKGWDATKDVAVSTSTWVQETATQVANSQFVADVQSVSQETVGELENFVQRQMQQSPSLQPFAKKEYVSFIVYSLLALPPLFVTLLLRSCMQKTPSSEGPPKKNPVAAAATHPPKKGHKTQKKGKKVSHGRRTEGMGA